MTVLAKEYELELFYDGDCPLCRREIQFVRRLDAQKGKILFTDISSADFRPENVGISFSTLMEKIHARLPDGTIIEGVEVFRRLYSAVGFRWLVSVTRLPVIRTILDIGYIWFAANRLRLTGRCIDGQCAVPIKQTAGQS